MSAREVQAVVNLVGNNNAVGVFSRNGQQSIDIAFSTNRATRVVGIDEHQQPNIIVHFRSDIREIRLPSIVLMKLIFDRFCTVHLWIGHVRRIVGARRQHFRTLLKNSGKNQLKRLGNTMAHIDVISGRIPAFSLLITSNRLT